MPHEVLAPRPPASEMADLLERYSTDRSAMMRFYNIETSATRRARMDEFCREWNGALGKLDFDAMGLDGKVDYLLFRNHLLHERRQLDLSRKRWEETESLIPFGREIMDLQEARRRLEPVDPRRAAALLTGMNRQVEERRKLFEEGLKPDAAAGAPKPGKTLAYRAAAMSDSLRNTLRDWFGYYNGYDPVFTWWVGDPHKKLDQTLQDYSTFLREKVVGLKKDDKETIIGDPIGREALLNDLEFEMIPYTPEELIDLAKRELAWCDAEMLRASRELGFGDDWKKALEHVKALHVEPGRQPELIKELAQEAIRFLDEHDLVTVPQMARDIWRVEMLSPEAQLQSPFFLGGEVIRVSYPTNTMTHEQKLMSMRGNNVHFSRATVHHELIPGHHLQGFMTQRYNTHRRLFSTAFWGEGWAFYWEMLLWDLNFPKSPEDRIGFLFWRMHRCARIIFSLNFHTGKMTPQECIDFLVQRVGHEPDNASAEVRRSFAGDYGPLYQSAYMLGALQFRALHRELVGSGTMTNRDFHDAILKLNRIPVEMVRATLMNQVLTRDFRTSWRFYE